MGTECSSKRGAELAARFGIDCGNSRTFQAEKWNASTAATGVLNCANSKDAALALKLGIRCGAKATAAPTGVSTDPPSKMNPTAAVVKKSVTGPLPLWSFEYP